jgi:cyclopropane fatty-acyl-phospholipid synthase-like methyltransferase
MTNPADKKSFWRIYTPRNIYYEALHRLRSLKGALHLNTSQRTPEAATYNEDHALSVRDFYDLQHDKFMRVYGSVIQAFRTKDVNDLLQYQVDSMGLSPGQKVLDAGCGVATPALYFARHAGVRVDGLTISQKQYEAAVNNIAAEGMGDRVTVTRGDYHRLPDYFEPASYDVVCFLESLGHSRDKARILEGCWTMLKPGGLLYIKDLFKRIPVRPEHKKKLQRKSAQSTKPIATTSPISIHSWTRFAAKDLFLSLSRLSI